MRKLWEKAKAAWRKIDWKGLREKASIAAAAWIIKQMNRRSKPKPTKTDCPR